MKNNHKNSDQIEQIKKNEPLLPKLRKKGFANTKKLEEIKTKLYLGDYKGKKVNFSECTPIPLQERSFNEIHSTMINNLGDLSRDLKRGASVILSSPSLRRSGRRTRSMNLGGGF